MPIVKTERDKVREISPKCDPFMEQEWAARSFAGAGLRRLGAAEEGSPSPFAGMQPGAASRTGEGAG